MLGLGELIFVLVIVVQGVAAIAAAAQKKKKRALARAKEIAAEEERSGTSRAQPASAFDRQSDLGASSDRARAMEERKARNALKQQKREAQMKKLQDLMQGPTGQTMNAAMSGLFPNMVAGEVDANATGVSRQQASATTNSGAARGGALSPAPPLSRPSIPSPVKARSVSDDASFDAFQTTVRKPKPSPFAGLQEDGGDASARDMFRVGRARALSVRGALHDRRALRQAFVLKTLLEPPVALREDPRTVD